MLNRLLGEVLGQRVQRISEEGSTQPRLGSPLSTHVNTYLSNNSGTVGYCAMQASKGRIIVIDNQLYEGMIINRKYVIGHSTNLVLRRPGISNGLS